MLRKPGGTCGCLTDESADTLNNLIISCPALQVVYALYLSCGPWCAARFLSAAPLGVYFPAGVLLRPPLGAAAPSGDPLPVSGGLPLGGWRFIRMPDTLIRCAPPPCWLLPSFLPSRVSLGDSREACTLNHKP